jgi:hypothetical protein
MRSTYHLRAGDIDNDLIINIKKLFHEDDNLTITVISEHESKASGHEKLLRFFDLEKQFPPVQVTQDLDFNSIVDEINL